jgi:isocitrate dehydrogenase
MTKDLAILVGPGQEHLTTEAFLAAVDAGLRAAIG